MTKVFRKSRSMSLIRAWKTAGAIVNPNGMIKVLKVPQVSVKPRLPFIPLTDMYQVVRVAQVELGEHCGVG